MKVEEERESKIRLSLIDVIYGIVLTYGFQYFDQIIGWVSYALFGFAYFIIIIDWLYIHSRYWSSGYKDITFFLDVIILFLFSRLIYSSTNGNSIFWLLLSALFLIYAIWDYVCYKKAMPSPYDWLYSLVADSLASIALFVFYWVIARKLMSTCPWLLTGSIFYVIANRLWFVPKDPAQRKKFFKRLTIYRPRNPAKTT